MGLWYAENSTRETALTQTFLAYTWENKHLSTDIEELKRSGPALPMLQETTAELTITVVGSVSLLNSQTEILRCE